MAYRCGNEFSANKRVSQSFYDLSQHIAHELAGSRNSRLHVDANQDERILVYPFFRDAFLALTKDHRTFLRGEESEVKVLRVVTEAIQEHHAKKRIHNGEQHWSFRRVLFLWLNASYCSDVKPDNIMVNWACDENGNKTVTKAALGDFDIPLNLQGGKAVYGPHVLGNAMWCGLEGQTGRGATKASDIYSLWACGKRPHQQVSPPVLGDLQPG